MDSKAALARRAMDSLRRIVRVLRVSASESKREHGISGAQRFVLEQLAEAPASSIAELARRTLTDPSSVSVVVSRLEAAGLVVRQSAASDARKSELALSRSGRARVRRAPPTAQERLIAAMGALPANELQALSLALEKVVDAIGSGAERATMFFEEEEEEQE